MKLKCIKLNVHNHESYFRSYAGQLHVLYSFLTKTIPSDPTELIRAFRIKMQQAHEVYLLFDMEMNNMLVGTVTVVPLPRLHGGCRTDCLLEDLVVHKSYQGKGVGRRLVEVVKKRALHMGWKILLRCNDELVPFYEKFNFKNVGNYCKCENPAV